MESLRRLIARILDVPEASITDEASPETIPSWDSFNGLMMVAELEKNFKVKFTISEVMSVTKVADIRVALKRHGVDDSIM
ncbi:acyl carrier protein [Candidatus Woesearchaeota archaeon]|nr:acyl carrier protein [Candidatus Woesearchaeota archaeon]